MPMKYLKDLKYLRSLSEDKTIQGIYAFNYGYIVGKQQERARRNGYTYKKATLVDDSFFKLYKTIDKATEGLTIEDLDEFFEGMKDYVATKANQSAQGKILSLLETIKKIKLQERNN